MAKLQSYRNSAWLTVACQDVSASGASVALESAETSRDGEITESETLGWLAMEVAQGSFMAGAKPFSGPFRAFLMPF